jgi:phosphoenolpyruvate carboxykinase (GTP)
VDSPIGALPAPGSLDVDRLDVTDAAMAELFGIDRESWLAECDLTEEYFAVFGDHVPAALYDELHALRSRLRS